MGPLTVRGRAEERCEPRGQRPRPEGGEVVVEVAVRGGEDGGGEALRERPGLEPDRGTPALGITVAGDEEAGGAGGRDEGGEAAGRQCGGGVQRGDGGDEEEDGLDALADEEGGAVAPGRPEAHGVAVDASEGLAGLGNRGLGGAAGMEPGALHAFERPARAGDGGDEGGEAAPARIVAVGERGMEAQRREAAGVEAPGAEVGFRPVPSRGRQRLHRRRAAAALSQDTGGFPRAASGSLGAGRARKARASSRAGRSDRAPMRWPMRSRRSPCSPMAASVHLPGGPGGRRRTNKDRPRAPPRSPATQYRPCLRPWGR